MPTVIRTPVSSKTPPGHTALTVVGSASVHQALNDSSDLSYVTVPSGYIDAARRRSTVVFDNLNLPAGSVIEWIRPTIRERHGSSSNGYLTIRNLTGYNASGAHSTPTNSRAIGTAPNDNVWRTLDGNVATKAADGTQWSTCDPTKFEATLTYGPNWLIYDDWPYAQVSTPPAIARIELAVSYKLAPVVSSILPGPSVISETQPSVSWATDSTQEAYRVIVVGAGQTDGAGRGPGALNYDPTSVASPAWDSGMQFTTATSTVVATHLNHGSSYYVYVRSWAPRVNDQELASLWTTPGSFSVAALQIAAPSILVQNDADRYAMKVTVTRGPVPGGWFDPAFFTLQRQDTSGEWVDVQGATKFTGPGPWIFWDSTVKPGALTNFRARGIYITGSAKEVASQWASGSAQLTVKPEWWLKDRVDSSMNRRITVSDYSSSIPKPQEVAYGAGARGATVTHQGVRREQHQVKVWCQSAQEWADLRALIDTGRTLVLCSVFGDAWQVQVGDQATVEIKRAAPAPGETSPIRHLRIVNLKLIEVEQ